MNREQRRKLNKKLSTVLSKEQLDKIEHILAGEDLHPLIEGEKVKIDCDIIKSYPFWTDSNPKYKEFVENSKDKIFTVELEEKQKKNGLTCVLKEDESPLKWIFNRFELIIHLS